jgi:Protein of unknown function (DUF1800)
MDRRELLTQAFGKVTATDDLESNSSQSQKLQTDASFRKFANLSLPKRGALSTGLEPFAGTWNATQAMHLLRRTLFGFTQANLTQALSLNAGTCVDALLNIVDETIAPPLAVSALETVTLGETWINAPYEGTLQRQRGNSLQNWWTGLMLSQGFSLREKMVLFWHNHLATEIDATADAAASYRQNVLLRKFAVGNFKELVKQYQYE